MKTLLKWFALLLVPVLAALLWLAWPDLREPPVVESTALPAGAGQIEQGRYLARAGNCIACHTQAGQAPYAGGRRIGTPFGDVFSTNLTPDPETGLGAWTPGEFWRAMHHGRSRDGRLLYPAFPYTSYTRVSRQDSDAIFAYLQSLSPVAAARQEPELRFPYNTQLALRAWRALYFRPGEHREQAQRTPEWNRGAYLVEGLGHCNACHTARTALGGIDMARNYGGGPIPTLGWEAPPLAAAQPMSDAEAADMAELLQAGTSRRGVATGPMAEVVFHSLQYLQTADIDAMVTYIRSLPPVGDAPAPRRPRVSAAREAELMRSGEPIYRQHCADCHGQQGEGRDHVYPALAGNRMLTGASAGNAIRSVLMGGYGPSTARHPQPHGMPSFAQRLTPEEIAAVLTYARGSWGNEAAAVSPVEVQRH
ncbi:MAG TPA: cytochrome c [Solimonas sp.]